MESNGCDDIYNANLVGNARPSELNSCPVRLAINVTLLPVPAKSCCCNGKMWRKARCSVHPTSVFPPILYLSPHMSSVTHSSLRQHAECQVLLDIAGRWFPPATSVCLLNARTLGRCLLALDMLNQRMSAMCPSKHATFSVRRASEICQQHHKAKGQDNAQLAVDRVRVAVGCEPTEETNKLNRSIHVINQPAAQLHFVQQHEDDPGIFCWLAAHRHTHSVDRAPAARCLALL